MSDYGDDFAEDVVDEGVDNREVRVARSLTSLSGTRAC